MDLPVFKINVRFLKGDELPNPETGQYKELCDSAPDRLLHSGNQGRSFLGLKKLVLNLFFMRLRFEEFNFIQI